MAIQNLYNFDHSENVIQSIMKNKTFAGEFSTHHLPFLYESIFLIFSVILLSIQVVAQTETNRKWWNPATAGFPVLEGQAWPREVEGFFDRLPARAQQTVRPESALHACRAES
jgi:hypothetical protein